MTVDVFNFPIENSLKPIQDEKSVEPKRNVALIENINASFSKALTPEDERDYVVLLNKIQNVVIPNLDTNCEFHHENLIIYSNNFSFKDDVTIYRQKNYSISDYTVLFSILEKKPMPLNGISELEFKAVKKFYQEYLKGNIFLKGSINPIDEIQLNQAVIKLLTRRIGREILFQTERMMGWGVIPRITIMSSDINCYNSETGVLSININGPGTFLPTLNTDRKKVGTYLKANTVNPFYITLGHELIHAIHKDCLLGDPNVSLISAKEIEKNFRFHCEQVTITGLKKPIETNFKLNLELEYKKNLKMEGDSIFKKWFFEDCENIFGRVDYIFQDRLSMEETDGFDQLNENDLRSAFGLPPRLDHRGVILDPIEFEDYLKSTVSSNSFWQIDELLKIKRISLATLSAVAVDLEAEKVIRHYFYNRANLEGGDEIGRDLYFHAIQRGKINILLLLIDMVGLDTNLCDKYKDTPLFFAVEKGDLDIVNLLVERGAKLDVINKYGENLCHVAVESEKLHVLSRLVNLKVDVNKPNNKGITPLGLAKEIKNQEMIDFLLANGAS